MGVNENLTKKDESYEIKYIENEKLPRYILGNDKNVFNDLVKIFNKSKNKDLIL